MGVEPIGVEGVVERLRSPQPRHQVPDLAQQPPQPAELGNCTAQQEERDHGLGAWPLLCLPSHSTPC
eukprot:2003851-Lingulodinium_polyedra.AAC.1